MSFNEKIFKNDRHQTFYLSSGDENTKKIYFIHGWPELSLSWRNQMLFFANLGFHAIAPDMRGYGRSTVYNRHKDYCQEEIVKDMIELHSHLGGGKAIWIGHDWGSPVVWNIACHHYEVVESIVSLCVPFRMMENDNMLLCINRDLYPEDEFPYGQWEYQIFYRENFNEAKKQLDANPYNSVKCLFRSDIKENIGKKAPTSFVRRNGGWFRDGSAPDIPLDEKVMNEEDLDVFAKYLKANGFFGPGSWYMNTKLNTDYFEKSLTKQIEIPVLFLHAQFDRVCDTLNSKLCDQMRIYCKNLEEKTIDSGHWMAQEKPREVNLAIKSWLNL